VLLIAGVAMIVMGLNAGILGRGDAIDGAAVTERGIFRQGLRRVLAMGSHWGVYLFGVLLGFLPCGLLYPVFFSAAASGGILSGMFTMIVFGLGTVPAMLSFGVLVTGVRPRIKRVLYRLAALLILLLGVQTFLRGMAFNGWIPPGYLW
jgi:sulfite exporter TauE/SafE